MQFLERDVKARLLNTIDTALLLVQHTESEQEADFWLATAPHLQAIVLEMFEDIEDTLPSHRMP
eukprot:3257260-Karenia_brevis.AAC.1